METGMQSFADLSEKAKQQIRKLAWPEGAEISCKLCHRRSVKTAEQMDKYLSKWPKCPKCGIPASVRPL